MEDAVFLVKRYDLTSAFDADAMAAQMPRARCPEEKSHNYCRAVQLVCSPCNITRLLTESGGGKCFLPSFLTTCEDLLLGIPRQKTKISHLNVQVLLFSFV